MQWVIGADQQNRFRPYFKGELAAYDNDYSFVRILLHARALPWPWYYGGRVGRNDRTGIATGRAMGDYLCQD